MLFPDMNHIRGNRTTWIW